MTNQHFSRALGTRVETTDQLLADLRSQLLPLDAVELHSTVFGTLYDIRGTLTGPNGFVLNVRSIWMEEKLSGTTKFITLIPER